jgi:hypothetical protein
MWNLTPTDIQLAKEELKGRRAAVEARYAKDIKALDDDLAEIDTLERVAAAFALKHKAEAVETVAIPGSAPEISSTPVPETSLATAFSADKTEKLGEASRWRMSLGNRSETRQS